MNPYNIHYERTALTNYATVLKKKDKIKFYALAHISDYESEGGALIYIYFFEQ